MHSLIKSFVRHPVAPNLAMFVMIIAGVWATGQLTRQLLPAFQLNLIEVNVNWPGAAAEDVESLVTQPLEDQLQGLDDVRSVSSTSQDSFARISLEYPEDANLGRALDEVKDRVAQIRNLPETSEEPRVSLRNRNEPVAKMLVTGPVLDQLRPLVRRFERELRNIGIARLEIVGVPKEEISIELPADRLDDLNLSLQDVANNVRRASQDLPAGSVGERDVARQLRSLDQKRTVTGFSQLVVAADSAGGLLRLGDIAQVERRALSEEARILANGKPAIEIQISRSEQEDALNVAETLYGWLETAKADLPPNINVFLYDETWRNVDNRIDLMVSNAASGLVLVLVILFIFLNGRVAFWVSVGIPVSVLTAMVALYYLGGTINIMSLFAMIMTFGIIVDDAIVVGEEAVTLYQAGAGPAAAAEKAAITMLAPVTAASLTTIAAFLPLMTIGGSTGSILFSIPLIVVCVIIASLIECFLVLPGHLRHSLEGTAEKPISNWRRNIDVAFNRFREGKFRTAVEWSVKNRRVTVSAAFAGLIVILGLVAGGRLGFSFFPQPEGTTITANARFVSGSPEVRVESFLEDAEFALKKAEAQIGEDVVTLVIKKLGQDSRGTTGSHVGNLVVELKPGDERTTTNADLIRAWRRNIGSYAGLEYFLILNSRGGPPGADIDIQLTGADPETLKTAALELRQILGDYAGVSGIRDDTTYGREQLIFELSPVGQAIGLSGQQLGEQLRATFEGELVQIFQDEGEEVEVRVRLAESERQALRSLETLPIQLSSGETAILSNVAQLDYARGFDALKHSDGQLAVRVTADVDPNLNNANALRGRLVRDVLPGLSNDFGVVTTLRGQAENQSESLGGVTLALPLALLLIYIILAWVFASYVWPLAVLSVVPFGLVGAVFGHWLLGFDVTMLSIFGFFGLTGIVINDSIILVDVFKKLREKGATAIEAAIDAGCRRLRAVLLTSVTTVAGIMPLLLETSREAQFLKPMVISISFGLIFGTFLVLFLLPATLVAIESLRARLNRIHSEFKDFVKQVTPGSVIAAGISRAMSRRDPTTEQQASPETRT